MRIPAALLSFVALGLSQQVRSPQIDGPARAAAMETLVTKITASYVIPETAPAIVAALRTGQHSGMTTAQDFADELTRILFAASHDKHLRVYYDPLPSASPSPNAAAPPAPRERFGYGFGRLERLRGNVGYLEISSFEPVDRAAETAGYFLSALSTFDAVILDLRKNGGGNSPMTAFVASYFFNATPVHLMDIHWHDTNETSQFYTWPLVPGKRSASQPLYILTSASTFSAAEAFVDSLQKLKRATVVGEQTGGGAHSGRGLQRLSPLFTAFVPVGRSINPTTKTNWERTGVEPDIKVEADQALTAAHLAALKRLAEGETDEQWKQRLLTLIKEGQ